MNELGSALSDEGVDLTGRTLYLGSCDVMDDKRAVRKLRDQSRLDCVCGYAGTAGVDWLESAAFELLLFQSLATRTHAQDHYALRDLIAEHGQLAQHLMFTVDPQAPSKRHSTRSA